MASRKRKMTSDRDVAVAVAVVVVVHHRYPTRWKLRQLSRVEDKAKVQTLVPCKRREERHNPYFSREIMFNILVHLPAKFLHEVVRFVCKQWYDIVSDPLFARAHSQLCSAVFLLQEPWDLYHFYYIVGDNVELKMTEIQLPFPARILGSSNGLILIQDLTNMEIFHVMNPVTKVKISLPPVVESDQIYSTTGFALDSSGHCKVVHVGRELHNEQYEMRVFTIGVDKAWRFINPRCVPPPLRCLGSIGGLIYWSFPHLCLTLDVDTETVYQFSEPKGLVEESIPFKYMITGIRSSTQFLSMGTGLGCMKAGGDIWRSWKLTDFKTDEWSEGAGINIPAFLSKLDEASYPRKCSHIWPFRFVDGEFWFSCSGVSEGYEYTLGRYSLASKNLAFLPIKKVLDFTPLHPHIHTLCSPNHC